MKNLNKFLILLAAIIILIIGFGYIKSKSTGDPIKKPIYSKQGNQNIYFTDKNIHPKISAELGKEFRINIGQIASFKEDFEVILVGYQYGCGGRFDELRNLIIKRAEASECAEMYQPVYAVVKDGEAFLGNSNYYLNGYQILTTSSSSEKDGYTNIIVSLLDSEYVKKMKADEGKHY